MEFISVLVFLASYSNANFYNDCETELLKTYNDCTLFPEVFETFVSGTDHRRNIVTIHNLIAQFYESKTISDSLKSELSHSLEVFYTYVYNCLYSLISNLTINESDRLDLFSTLKHLQYKIRDFKKNFRLRSVV